MDANAAPVSIQRMVRNACAVIVADEGALIGVAGAPSLEHVVHVLRRCPRVKQIFVLTTEERVRNAATNLGVVAIEDQAWAQQHIHWRDAGLSGSRSAPPDAATGSDLGSFSLVFAQNSGRPPRGLTAPWRALVERENYDALLLWNGHKPLPREEHVDAALDALELSGTALLAEASSRVWKRSDADELVRIDGEGLVDSESLYAMRVGDSSSGVEAIRCSPELAWQVTEPVQRVAVEAVLLARQRERWMARVPAVVSGLAMDFDGVFTENGVWVNELGEEFVRCDRSDGLGLGLLKRAGLPMVVISKERNLAVKARCDKLEIECHFGIDEKLSVLRTWAESKGIPREELLYVGNDINDLECLGWAGCGVAVADAYPPVLEVADWILTKQGGRGALRELADAVLERVRGYFPVVPVPNSNVRPE